GEEELRILVLAACAVYPIHRTPTFRPHVEPQTRAECASRATAGVPVPVRPAPRQGVHSVERGGGLYRRRFAVHNAPGGFRSPKRTLGHRAPRSLRRPSREHPGVV